MMKDKGLDKALVQDFDTSNRRSKGHFYGFRKMFWTYLNKLGVPFYDPCCPEASNSDNYTATRFNTTTGVQEYYDRETNEWTDVADWTAPSTTTTTTTV